jgi:hypothetical protein
LEAAILKNEKTMGEQTATVEWLKPLLRVRMLQMTEFTLFCTIMSGAFCCTKRQQNHFMSLLLLLFFTLSFSKQITVLFIS